MYVGIRRFQVQKAFYIYIPPFFENKNVQILFKNLIKFEIYLSGGAETPTSWLLICIFLANRKTKHAYIKFGEIHLLRNDHRKTLYVSFGGFITKSLAVVFFSSLFSSFFSSFFHFSPAI